MSQFCGSFAESSRRCGVTWECAFGATKFEAARSKSEAGSSFSISGLFIARLRSTRTQGCPGDLCRLTFLGRMRALGIHETFHRSEACLFQRGEAARGDRASAK